jgi:hypothetical protein
MLALKSLVAADALQNRASKNLKLDNGASKTIKLADCLKAAPNAAFA